MPFALAQAPLAPASRDNYTKTEAMIPMRDGTKLYTAIYTPKDQSQKYPFLMMRTPYGVGSYGADRFPRVLGPSSAFQTKGYVFVFQDIRGRWMSEGTQIYSRPPKQPGTKFDEATDAYDTVEWLLKNVPNNNGRVGVYGISQPGFYAGNALISGHPAIRAVSPQAPVTDRFKGDDDHHNGAYFLAQRFSLLSSFGRPRPLPTNLPAPGFGVVGPDAYRYFLGLGPLPNYTALFKDNVFWPLEMAHPNYDDYWKPRGMEQYYRDIKGPAVLTVGGFYDAEDLWGALHTYYAIERQSPGIDNTFVMGPWWHGQWGSDLGERIGAIEWDSKTGDTFREEVELPFFEHYLRDAPDPHLPEAMVFESGTNKWRRFDQWPPKGVQPRTFYFRSGGTLLNALPPKDRSAFESYVSDPRRPVPYTGEMTATVNRTFMVENQRFAWTRPDVLSFQTDPLTEDLTLAGPIQATLNVTCSTNDADFVVKIIDVYPDDAAPNTNVTPAVRMAGYQMLVRWEVMRGRFRDSLEKPAPLRRGRLTTIPIALNDVMHTFRKGHRLMVQVQSSMFPLVDLNPQRYVNIYHAKPTDFQSATIRVCTGGKDDSKITVGTLPTPP